MIYPHTTDPVAWSLSQNLHRRHLTTNQRAMVAAKLATLKHGDVKSQRKDDVSFETSSGEAATLLNISRASAMRAKHVLEHASAPVARRGGKSLGTIARGLGGTVL